MILKVLTYNIHKGFNVSGFKFTLHQIKKAIHDTGADICLLQEVVGENRKYQKSIADWPTQAQFEFLADTVWPHYAYGKNAVFSLRHHGNALLSRFPIIHHENINISLNKLEQRGLLHCEVMIPDLGKTLHIFNVHLNLREEHRKIQLEKVIKRAQSHVPLGAAFLMGGDFNDWTSSLHPMVIHHLGMYESHHSIHKTAAKSFPSFMPSLPLDRLYFRDLRVLHSRVLAQSHWASLSDHLPLYAEFEIE
jgi:endonuclease/exonuclease/phosphatase family metal-dependent hydrolase